MEKIKMYAVKWRGKASDYGYEAMHIIEEIVKTCMECCGGDIYTRYRISGGLKFETVKIDIVTLGKEKAVSMVEWFKDKVGMEMKMEEIEVSPLPFRIKNVAGESGERTLSNSAGF